MARIAAFLVALVCAIAPVACYVQTPTRFASGIKTTKLVSRATTMTTKGSVDFGKIAASILPAVVSAPAWADSEVVSSLPTFTTSLEVTFAAYLAVLLGTFVPVAFLIILYLQSESRKAGERDARN